MAYADNSGSALTILFNFFKMKRANRYMIIVFQGKFHLEQLDLFCSEAVFYCLIGHEIEPGHCYYWILKQSGHYYFHD